MIGLAASLHSSDFSLPFPFISLQDPGSKLYSPVFGLHAPWLQWSNAQFGHPRAMIVACCSRLHSSDFSLQFPFISLQAPGSRLYTPVSGLRALWLQCSNAEFGHSRMSAFCEWSCLHSSDFSLQFSFISLQDPGSMLYSPVSGLHALWLQCSNAVFGHPRVMIVAWSSGLHALWLQSFNADFGQPWVMIVAWFTQAGSSLHSSDFSLQFPFISLQYPDSRLNCPFPFISLQAPGTKLYFPASGLQVPLLLYSNAEFGHPRVMMVASWLRHAGSNLLSPDFCLQFLFISLQALGSNLNSPDSGLQVPWLQCSNAEFGHPRVMIVACCSSLQSSDFSFPFPFISLWIQAPSSTLLSLGSTLRGSSAPMQNSDIQG
ncbi:hypothetical protein HPB47_000939 [Ixodes persulcatus]|uniref:Uncharacterized protein n=1 Tax=Ixodes persulcatus TaxID=34615 RepID=A0AC60PS29_IXOPE|nr:hypothetical protein HPB47_000939 [Ixodes persulcatus]